MGLAIISKYREEKDIVGMEMQSLQLVMAEDREEELGEGRHQAATMALTKSG